MKRLSYTSLGRSLTGWLRLSFVAALVCCVAAEAAARSSHTDSVGVFLRLIKDYDPAPLFASAPDSCPAALWKTLVEHDRRLADFNSDLRRGRRHATRAAGRHALLPRLSVGALLSEDTARRRTLDSLSAKLGFDTAVCIVRAFDYDQPLVVTALTDRGFAILLSTALLSRSVSAGGSCDALAGVCCREYAHGVLMHPLQQFYEWERRSARHRMWAFLASVLAPGTANAYLDYNTYYENLAGRYDRDADEALQWRHFMAEPMTYHLPLSDEKQVEADIIACRMMQRLGLEEAFTASLRLYASMAAPGLYSLPAYTSDELRFRQALVGYIIANPDLKSARRAHDSHLRSTDPLYND